LRVAFANQCLDATGVCPNKVNVVVTGQATVACLEIQLVDPNTGQVVDLTTFNIPRGSSSSSSSSSSSEDPELKHGVEFVAKELPDIPTPLFTKFGTIESAERAAQGFVQLPVGRVETEKAGIWCMMAVVWQDGFAKKLIPFYYDIQPNLLENSFNGPLTAVELRMAIRDRCALDNFLLDDIEFKQEELYLMMRRAVDNWNEEPPPGFEFSPVTFPYRYNWCNAVIGELLIMAAYQLRRNKLDYTAGGVQIEDEARWEVYLAEGRRLREEYKAFIRRKKLELNVADGFQSLGGYRHVVPR
jgi:hypothetical protein